MNGNLFLPLIALLNGLLDFLLGPRTRRGRDLKRRVEQRVLAHTLSWKALRGDRKAQEELRRLVRK